MAEYIEKEALRAHLNECITNELFDGDMKKAVFGIDIFVENMPVADVQPSNRKPIKITEAEFWVQGFLVQEKYYCCPNCEKVLGNLRVHNVHELINEYKFCNECGQGLDWNEIKEVIVK